MKKRLFDQDHNWIDGNEIASENSDRDLKSIAEVADRAMELMDEIDLMEEAVKAKREQLRRIQIEQLPAMMLAAGTARFTTFDGLELQRGTKVEGALPKDNNKRAAAITLIEQLGAGDLIKTDVVVNFAREKRSDAMKLLQQLRQRGMDPSYIADVHHMTLKAWAHERLENGESVPADSLGLWIGDFVDVKRKTAPKTKVK